MNVPPLRATMRLHLPVRLLSKGNSSEQRLQQPAVAPIRVAVSCRSAHHHPRTVKRRRRIVGPLNTLAVGAINVGVFAQQLQGTRANRPEFIEKRIAALKAPYPSEGIAYLEGFSPHQRDAPTFSSNCQPIESKSIAAHPGLNALPGDIRAGPTCRILWKLVADIELTPGIRVEFKNGVALNDLIQRVECLPPR